MCLVRIKNEPVFINEDLVNERNLLNLFFAKKTETIYLSSDSNPKRADKLITIGSFFSSESLSDCVRNIGFFVRYSNNREEEVEEAIKIMDEKMIKSAIPVIDDGGCIIYEVERIKNKPYVDDLEKRLLDKLYSSHLKDEYRELRNILTDKNTVLLGDPNNIPDFIRFLVGQELYVKLQDDVSDFYQTIIEGEKLYIDLDRDNNLVHRVLDNNLSSFISYGNLIKQAYQFIESEYLSRINKLSEFDTEIIKSYFNKFVVSGEKFILNKIIRNIFLSKLRGIGVPCLLPQIIRNKELTKVSENGYTRTAKNMAIWFVGLDRMLQFFRLSEYCKNHSIDCLNFVTDGDVKLSNAEKNSIERQNYFKEYYINDRDTLLSMYEGSGTAKEDKINCIADYGVSLCRRIENDLLVTAEYEDEYFNVENGLRKTIGNPEEYSRTVYIFGACTIFGTVVSDEYTIPSLIQKKINNNTLPYRVVNMGISGSMDAVKALNLLKLKKGDIVIVLYTHIVDEIKSQIETINILPEINRRKAEENNQIFFDSIAHVGETGNKLFADEMYKWLEPKLCDSCAENESNNIYSVFKKDETDLNMLYHLDVFKEMLSAEKRKLSGTEKKIGSIVMNANPFSKGHKHLAEYAANKCDYLFIFVVEEDQSFFSTDDRYEMVKRGMAEYTNVSVVKSGKIIVSEHTLPEYFNRERKRDSEGNQHLKNLYASSDVRLFGEYLAPIVGINVRFVGEEPLDPFTAQYNNSQKKILPMFGIDVEEIPRITDASGEVISASTVRKYYKNKDFERLKDLCPQTTIDYLMELED